MKVDKTKIICTLSPKLADEHLLSNMMLAGMDVARLNFSHSSFDDALKLIHLLRELRKSLRTPLAIMLDTKGPESRMYGANGEVTFNSGDTIDVESYVGKDIGSQISPNGKLYYTNLPGISDLVSEGDRVLLNDGMIECFVKAKAGGRISIEAKNSGTFKNKTHFSIPGLDYPLPFMSAKDAEDISFAVREDLEYIALSFVRSAEDIFQVKNLIYDVDPDSKIKIISKIEHKKAIDNLDEIIRHSDGIMVARGDLGVELDFEDVPIMQKMIVKSCYSAGKPVIIATQMLETMLDHRLPSRAEVSDVANACFDLASAVMLSGETAVGKFPLLVVETMQRILCKVEKSFAYDDFLKTQRDIIESTDLTSVLTFSAVNTAYKCKAKALIVFTNSGYSAKMISRLRPGLPIHAITLDEKVYNQLALSWGVLPHLVEDHNDFEVLVKRSIAILKRENMIEGGDNVVIVAGVPLGLHGRTNMIRVESVA